MDSLRSTTTGLVRFADTAKVHICNQEHSDVARHELWYTVAEIDSMRRTAQDVRHVRAQALVEVPFNCAV